MKNILIDKLPTSIGGHSINSNFRIGIIFETMIYDQKLSQEEKINLAINLFYSDPVENYYTAMEDIIWFYSCGKNPKIMQKKEYDKQIYSFEYDADYIFSAFLSQYNIDLNSIEYLHWWKFKALFNCLNEDHLFTKIMSYRAINLSKIKDKEQLKYYRDLKIKYKLPDGRTDEEKEKDFANALG